MRLNNVAFLFIIATISAVAQRGAHEYQVVESFVTRLSPRAFPALPVQVAAALEREGYTIPQSWNDSLPHNVIVGEFRRRGQRDWAVLASRNHESRIIIFWNGLDRDTSYVSTREDILSMQDQGNRGISYARYIQNVRPDVFDPRCGNVDSTSSNTDHDAIKDHFIPRESDIFYFRKGKWFDCPGEELISMNPDNVRMCGFGAERFIVSLVDIGYGRARLDVRRNNDSAVVYSIKLMNVSSGHYHAYEYHNGNLYVLHTRTSSDESRRVDQRWMDELWRYDKNKIGNKLYAAQGLDFRVCPDEHRTVAQVGDEIRLLDTTGVEIRKFTKSEFLVHGIGDLYLSNDYLFVFNGDGDGFDTIVRLNMQSNSLSRIALQNLNIGSDYSFNPIAEQLAASNYPWIVSADDRELWESEKHKVTLYLYDLISRNTTILSRSIARDFNPVWIDEGTIEYTNPDTSQRVTYRLQK